MLQARLADQSLIYSLEYDENIHGTELYCMDPDCGALVIYLAGNENIIAHFKTTGGETSKHGQSCMFFKSMGVSELVEKIRVIQEKDKDSFKQELRFNLNSMDPEREKKNVERNSNPKSPIEPKIKESKSTTKPIQSLAGVVSLLSQNSPDILTTIYARVGGGIVLPLSALIHESYQVHDLLWEGELNPEIGYFIIGTVDKIWKNEKVKYIKLHSDSGDVSAVLFQRYFKYFTYSDSELIDKKVILYGMLRKNEYQDRKRTDILIKSDDYLIVLE